MNHQASIPTVSAATLIKLTVVATLLAFVTLTVVILPAEYNLDPTGLGKALGLTALSPEAIAAAQEQQTAPATSADQGNQLIELVIPAHGDLEYKLNMKRHDSVTYEWMTNGTDLYVDMHGEPAGDTSGYFRSYTIATAETMKGSFDAAFDGTHGWYWKNNTDQDVPVLLVVEGEFEVAGKR